MLRYRAFGLDIASEIPLGPAAPPHIGEGLADVTVTLSRAIVRSTGGTPITWDGLCEIQAHEGKVLEVRPSSNASESDLCLAASGAGIALVLEQRGLTVLHGSCVAISGRGVCILGPSGAGKSTLAASLGARGHALVSDGMTALDMSGPSPMALPGWPKLKLLPDAAQALGLEASESLRVHPDSTKQLFDANRTAQDPVPLCRVFVLALGPALGRRVLRGDEAVIELMRNYFLVAELQASAAPSIMSECASIARQVRVVRLERTVGLTELDQLATLVEQATTEP